MLKTVELLHIFVEKAEIYFKKNIVDLGLIWTIWVSNLELNVFWISQNVRDSIEGWAVKNFRPDSKREEAFTWK